MSEQTQTRIKNMVKNSMGKKDSDQKSQSMFNATNIKAAVTAIDNVAMDESLSVPISSNTMNKSDADSDTSQSTIRNLDRDRDRNRIHMELQVPRQKRKRTKPSSGGTAAPITNESFSVLSRDHSSSSSSSNSSDDEMDNCNDNYDVNGHDGNNDAKKSNIDKDASNLGKDYNHSFTQDCDISKNPKKLVQHGDAEAETNNEHKSHSQESSLLVKQTMHQTEGWRVKLYRLNLDGSWDDCGTGRIVCLYKTSSSDKAPRDSPQDLLYQELGEPTLCMQAESSPSKVLLRTKILLRDAYQRQGDNIITWCEPFFEDASSQQRQQDGQPQGVDLALSFQENAGCLDVWRQITHVQSRAADWFRLHGAANSTNSNNQSSAPIASREQIPSVTDMAQAVAAAHHATLQRQQQHAMWVNVASEAVQLHLQHAMEEEEDDDDDPTEFREQDAEAVAVSMAAAAAAAAYGGAAGPELPHPPTLHNLEEIADLIAAAQTLTQRESLAMIISKNECLYLKDLLKVFEPAETRQDYGSLATLAACVKAILLLNDPSVIDCVVNDEKLYEQICSTLEYDPDLRDKANHRWFLRERAKFRTVVLMEDEELISAIHRSFRVAYLRDTLLRPTMDESSLSSLASLQTFTHTFVVKGVTSPSRQSGAAGDSYLVRVMRTLGKEVTAINEMEWDDLDINYVQPPHPESPEPVIVTTSQSTWNQYLAPQDDSLGSRKIRRRGCLLFFRELFSMVRTSLQQSDKDDFYAAIVCMDVSLDPTEDHASLLSIASVKNMTTINRYGSETINILSLLAAILSDPLADSTERASALEIVGAIAMHDPSHIRRHSLEVAESSKYNEGSIVNDLVGRGKPIANQRRQIVFKCPPNDVIASLLFVLAVETDAGLLLQTTEIMRIILDSDMFGETGQMGTGIYFENSDVLPVGLAGNHQNGKGYVQAGTSVAAQESDQNQFLSLFYEHYMPWLVVPFQHRVLHPTRRMPDCIFTSSGQSPILNRMMRVFQGGVTEDSSLFRIVPDDAMRGSFTVELISFCVRAHMYRMKFFLLRSRVLGSVLNLLHPSVSSTAGDRCLKLSALRLLRSILSVKDEFYHRHIVQHNLFAPVFDAFRSNPAGDNLIASAVVEMCDFIRNEKVKSLIEHIVTKHLMLPTEAGEKSLEDVSMPYVSTLSMLRKFYEDCLNAGSTRAVDIVEDNNTRSKVSDHHRLFSSSSIVHPQPILSQKALDDQRKFYQVDADESYFDSDDDDAGLDGSFSAGAGSADDCVGSDRADSTLSLSI